jgi:hypothetical protein
MATAHIFWYHWPRLKLSPKHEVQEVRVIDQVVVAKKSFILFEHNWYVAIPGNNYRVIPRLVSEREVDPELKTLALVLT